MFSCEFCEISKNTFFTEHLRANASEKALDRYTLLIFETSDNIPHFPTDILFMINFAFFFTEAEQFKKYIFRKKQGVLNLENIYWSLLISCLWSFNSFYGCFLWFSNGCVWGLLHHCCCTSLKFGERKKPFVFLSLNLASSHFGKFPKKFHC